MPNLSVCLSTLPEAIIGEREKTSVCGGLVVQPPYDGEIYV